MFFLYSLQGLTPLPIELSPSCLGLLNSAHLRFAVQLCKLKFYEPTRGGATRLKRNSNAGVNAEVVSDNTKKIRIFPRPEHTAGDFFSFMAKKFNNMLVINVETYRKAYRKTYF